MRVRWTEPAARDLTQICDYIEEHQQHGASRRVRHRNSAEVL
jgi:plasmid stabilization system protein ParE